jgi:hypothetical protein
MPHAPVGQVRRRRRWLDEYAYYKRLPVIFKMCCVVAMILHTYLESQ